MSIYEPQATADATVHMHMELKNKGPQREKKMTVTVQTPTLVVISNYLKLSQLVILTNPHHDMVRPCPPTSMHDDMRPCEDQMRHGSLDLHYGLILHRLLFNDSRKDHLAETRTCANCATKTPPHI